MYFDWDILGRMNYEQKHYLKMCASYLVDVSIRMVDICKYFMKRTT